MNNLDNNSSKQPLTEKEKQELTKKLLTDWKEENRAQEEGNVLGVIMGIFSFIAVAVWMFIFRGCSF